MVLPPDIERQQILAAFQNCSPEANYIKLPDVQVVREPVIDRTTMRYTGDYLYQVMPPVAAAALIERDIDKLVAGPFSLKTKDILDYLDVIIKALSDNQAFITRVMDIYRLTSDFPDDYLDSWATLLLNLSRREHARQMIDSELSIWGRPGGEFLDGWVEIPGHPITGSKNVRPRIRAMPTRQLHITAGNAPEVPLTSLLRALLTKSAAVIKLPYGAILPGTIFSLAAVAAAPEHPLTKNLSIVYWQGGDRTIEDELFSPHAFDRIVVWGSPETVESIQTRALFARAVVFNPRYGVSMIGHEAFSMELEDVTNKAVRDTLIYDQKACTSSLVHYVEGNLDEVRHYARKLQQNLASRDIKQPAFVPPKKIGQIKSLRRGKYTNAEWFLNEKDGRFTSGVVLLTGEFDILDHPMSRFVVVRPVSDLNEALQYMNPNVSTVGVYPEERRFLLRDRIAARGVSNVFPLGECERLYPGMPHDGMPVLNQLVDWKNA